MEITLDMGKNVHQSLVDIAGKNHKTPENFALDMVELGLRIFAANQAQADDSPVDLTSQLTQILKIVTEGRYQTEDVFRMIFDREKSGYRLFDAESTLALIKEKSISFQEGVAT